MTKMIKTAEAAAVLLFSLANILQGASCVGDVNRNGIVDNQDLAAVKAHFAAHSGQTTFDPAYDLNGDGVIDIRDLAMVAQSVGCQTAKGESVRSASAVRQASTAGPATLAVIAPSIVQVGDKFTVTIQAQGITDLYAFQFDLSFDPQVLQANSINEGSFLASGGSTVFIPGTIDNNAGMISGNAGTLVGNVPGVSGTGNLIVLQFTALAPGTATISLKNVVLLDSNSGEIAANLTSANITIQDTLDSPYQINYASNLNLGDGVLNLTNSGASAGDNTPQVNANSYGDICVNAYVYAPDQELATCCSCLVSPNSLHSWPVSFGPGNLLENVTNGAVLTSINTTHSLVVNLLATPASGISGSSATSAFCPGPDAPGATITGATVSNGLVRGLAAWGTHAQSTNTALMAITETPFVAATLSAGEYRKLTGDCQTLLTRGGSRVCPACRTGGLAVSDSLTPGRP